MVELNPFGNEGFDDPNRKTLLDSFQQDGFASGFGHLSQMVTPQSFYGNASIESVMQDFVEFSPYGDFKDVMAALKPGSGLDPLERTIAMLPLAGYSVAGYQIGKIGAAQTQARRTRLGNAVADTQVNDLQQAAMMESQEQQVADRSMVPGELTDPNGKLDFMDSLEDSALGEGRKRSKLQLAHTMVDGGTHTSAGHVFASDNMDQLAQTLYVLEKGEKGSGGNVHGGYGYDTIAEMPQGVRDSASAGLTAIGRAVVQELGPSFFPEINESTNAAYTEGELELLAAQFAVASWVTALENQLIMEPVGNGMLAPVSKVEGRLMAGLMTSTTGIFDVANTMDRVVKMQVLLAQKGILPDLIVTPQIEIAGIAFTRPLNGPNSKAKVMGNTPALVWGINSALQPTTRIVTKGGTLLADSKYIDSTLKSLNWMSFAGDMAANAIRANQQYERWDPDGFARSERWYYRLNDSIGVLSGHTGIAPSNLAVLISGLSPNTPWLPDNLLSAAHLAVQHSRPDLVPSSPEYKQIITEVIETGGWQQDLYDASPKHVKDQFAEGDLDGVVSYYAESSNSETQYGDQLAATSDYAKTMVKRALDYDMPIDLALGMAKTNSFALDMLDPDTEIVTANDVHANAQVLGMDYGGDPVFSKDGSQLVYNPEKIAEMADDHVVYTASTNRPVTAKLLKDYRQHLLDKGYSEEHATEILTSTMRYPAKAPAQQYEAVSEAYRIAAMMLGKKPHQIQSGGWPGTQRMRKWLAYARRGHGVEAAEARRRSVTDHSLMSTLEGNPLYRHNALGFVANASANLESGFFPGQMDNFFSTSSASPKTAYGQAHPVMGFSRLDGEIEVWADLTSEGTPEMVRHLVPSPVVIGSYTRMIPRTAENVEVISVRREQLAAATTKTGRPAAAQVRTYVGPFVPVALRSGNFFTFETAEANVVEIERIARSQGHPVEVEVVSVEANNSGMSSEHIASSHLQSMGPGAMTDAARSPIVNHDWVVISAKRSVAQLAAEGQIVSEAELEVINAKRHAELYARLKQRVAAEMGITRAEAAQYIQDQVAGEYFGDVEASFMVFGIDYKWAQKLGREFGQESVATRNGIIFSDGSGYAPVVGDVMLGKEAANNANGRSTVTMPDGTKAQFALEYDFERIQALPENNNDLMGQAVTAKPGEVTKQVIVDLGGVDSHVPWEVTDALWNAVRGTGKVTSSSASLHGDLWRPDGVVPVSENVYEGGGQTMVWRTGEGRGSRVLVPIEEALSMGRSTGTEESMVRTKKEAQALLLEGSDPAVSSTFSLPEVDVEFRGERIGPKSPPGGVLKWQTKNIINPKWYLDMTFQKPVLKMGIEQQTDLTAPLVLLTPLRDGTVELATNDPNLYAPAIRALDALGYKVDPEPHKIQNQEVLEPLHTMLSDTTPTSESEHMRLGEYNDGGRIGYVSPDLAFPPRAPMVYTTALRDAEISQNVSMLAGMAIDFKLYDGVSDVMAYDIEAAVRGLLGDVDASPHLASFAEETGGIAPWLLAAEDGLTEGINVLMSGGNEFAFFSEKRSLININQGYINLIEEIGEAGFNERMDLHSPRHFSSRVMRPVQDTLVHEIGHALHRNTTAFIDGAAGNNTAWGRTRIVMDTTTALGRARLSSYSVSSPAEFFAEAFNAVATGQVVDPVIREWVLDYVAASHQIQDIKGYAGERIDVHDPRIAAAVKTITEGRPGG